MAFLSALGGALGGASLGSAIVAVAVDTTQLKRGLAEAKGEVQAGTASMGSAFKALGPAIAASAVAGLAVFSAAAVKAASDETEALNKTNVVFKQSAGIVTDFAETSATSFGISKTAAYEAAGGFGNMLQAAGLAVDKSAEMSVELTQLAADLASFNNVDPAEALTKLASGLSGQARPLRAYGILLSEGRVKAEAYRSGIAEVGAELTDAQKVQARYNIIFQDSTRAQGDFSRTSDELANSQRILNAEWEDFQAQVGQALLPLMRQLVGVLKELIPLLTITAGHIGGIVTALSTGVPPAAQHLLELFGIISGGSGAIDSASEKTATYKEGLQSLGLQIQDGTLAYNDSVAAIEDLQSQYGVTGGSAESLALSLKNATTEQLANLTATNDGADASGNLQDRFLAEEQAASDAAAAEQAHADALKAVKAATDQLVPGLLAVQTAVAQQAQDQKELNKIQQQGGSGARFHAAQLAVLTDQLAVNGAISDYIDTLDGSKKSQRDAIGLLEHLGTQAGLTNRDVKALVNDALTAVGAKLDGVKNKANDAAAALSHLDGTKVNIDIITHLLQSGKLG